MTKDDTVSKSVENKVSLGRYWAALRGDQVINMVSMRVPNDVDFESFRIKVISALELLGDVRAGELYEVDKELFFLPRPHKHQNRSKSKPKVEIKPLKVYRPQYE